MQIALLSTTGRLFPRENVGSGAEHAVPRVTELVSVGPVPGWKRRLSSNPRRLMPSKWTLRPPTVVHKVRQLALRTIPSNR